MGSNRSDATQLARQLRREGFVVKLIGTGHWAVRTPSGERVTTFAQTPSDRRWRANAMVYIRRWKTEHSFKPGMFPDP